VTLGPRIRMLPANGKPVCADPEYLFIVDAAFDYPGGEESHWMRDNLCTVCPIRLECFLLGNASGEPGVWGGLNSNERVRAGGHSPRMPGGTARNMIGVVHGRDARTDRKEKRRAG
jgi:hypothetical protein